MRLRTLVMLLVVMVIAVGAVVTFVPTKTAEACLPCFCPVPNPPMNCYGPYTLFVHRYDNGTFDMEFLTLDGKEIFYLKAGDLTRLPIPPQHTMIARSRTFPIEVYKLADSGDYQIQVGPVTEKKVFVLILDDANGARLFEQDYPAP